MGFTQVMLPFYLFQRMDHGLGFKKSIISCQKINSIKKLIMSYGTQVEFGVYKLAQN